MFRVFRPTSSSPLHLISFPFAQTLSLYASRCLSSSPSPLAVWCLAMSTTNKIRRPLVYVFYATLFSLQHSADFNSSSFLFSLFPNISCSDFNALFIYPVSIDRMEIIRYFFCWLDGIMYACVVEPVDNTFPLAPLPTWYTIGLVAYFRWAFALSSSVRDPLLCELLGSMHSSCPSTYYSSGWSSFHPSFSIVIMYTSSCLPPPLSIISKISCHEWPSVAGLSVELRCAAVCAVASRRFYVCFVNEMNVHSLYFFVYHVLKHFGLKGG